MRAKNSSQCHHTDKYQKGHDQCDGQEVYLGLITASFLFLINLLKPNYFHVWAIINH